MLSAQVLALTLIPLLSGVVPGNGPSGVDLWTLLELERPLSKEFMVGTWKYSDYFVRWGITDKGKAKIQRVKGDSFMTLRQNGTMKMINLFRPSEGRWEISDRGLIFYDPKHPERGSQVLQVKKRDKNRIWLLLPYAGGANGIGMVRVPEEELLHTIKEVERLPTKKTSRVRPARARPRVNLDLTGPEFDALNDPERDLEP
ncbi:MAG: hypothetical protein P8182_14360 [Deltaproteobacteria bacterium]